MQAVLVMFRNDGERRSFSISREMTVIGRRQDCDLMIPLGEISRKHCRIIRDGESLRLEDLGSSNGTFLNGRRIQESTLDAGDTIQVGPVAFVIQIDGVPAEDEMQPHTGKAGAAAAGADDDDLETLSDDLDEATPSHELDDDADEVRRAPTAAGDDLEAAELDDELTGLEDDDAPKPARASAIDDELDLGSEEKSSGGGGGSGTDIHDLDAEIGENIDIDSLEALDDSGAGEITLDDKETKPRRK
jgi:predicted component of type VI protein secretion system